MLTGSVIRKVRLGGVEPPCSRVSDGRLDLLSYRREACCVFIQPGPLHDRSGGAESNRRLGGHSPALCRLSYAPGCCLTSRPPLQNRGSWSVPTRRPPAYEAGALPAELQERIAGVGFEPTSVAAYEAAALPLSYPAARYRRRDLNPHGPSPRRSERRASAVPPRRRVSPRWLRRESNPLRAGLQPAALPVSYRSRA
jgi:hypothetical protein